MPSSSLSHRKSAVTKALLKWYRKNARPSPWRKTRHPYRILVSEIMLQQTQVDRVEQKYPLFLRRFPTFQSLARARTADVIRAWAGMGYNNRAIHLQKTAQRVVEKYRGRLPGDIEALQQFPGIGRYTANAVACFAFGQHTAVVDTNVRRVLSRLFPKQSRSMDEWDLAEWILPKRKAYDWNQALMELGGTFCTHRNPNCSGCPLHRHCMSAFKIKKIGKPIPAKPRKAIPDRIYRGRIVSILRNIDHHRSMESLRLAAMINPGFRSIEKKWFDSLLQRLQRDGLILMRRRQKKLMIYLPK